MAKRRIAWTAAAIEDLERIIEYIARDSPRYALAFAGRVRAEARSLATFAERAPVVPEFGDETVRELFLHSYRLIFRVRDREVQILAVIHGARDLGRAWTEQERDL